MTDPHHGRDGRQRDRDRAEPTCSSTARRSRRSWRPAPRLLGADLAADVDTVIDATGKYVIPGGIDAHTHMELPFGGTNASDTFETGTRAAAWGGTTTHHRLRRAALRRAGRGRAGRAGTRRPPATARSTTASTRSSAASTTISLKAMEALVDEGITSFKLFMAYPGVFYSDDAQILRAMQKAAETGLLTMMHAENGPAIDVLAAQLVEQGKTDPYYHGIARAWQMEEEATHRAIMLADLTGAPLYVVHVSAKQAVEQLAVGPRQGQERLRRDLSAVPLPLARGAARREQPGVGRLRGCEVGLLDAAALARRGPPGPDVAGAAHERPADGLDRPLPVLHEGPEGARASATSGPFPNGIGSIEHRMDLMYQGVVTGRAHARALGRADLDHAGPDVRPVRPQGRHPAGRRRRRRDLRPERPHVDRRRQDATT